MRTMSHGVSVLFTFVSSVESHLYWRVYFPVKRNCKLSEKVISHSKIRNIAAGGLIILKSNSKEEIMAALLRKGLFLRGQSSQSNSQS